MGRWDEGEDDIGKWGDCLNVPLKQPYIVCSTSRGRGLGRIGHLQERLCGANRTFLWFQFLEVSPYGVKGFKAGKNQLAP
jgi:hypothetical protein